MTSMQNFKRSKFNMKDRCCVLGCISHYCTKIDKNITLHRFPTEPDLRLRWVEATGRRHWSPDENSRICSMHFNKYDIRIIGKGRCLRPGSIPYTYLEKSHEGSATPSEDSEVEIQRLAKKLTAALTTISVLTKKNGDLTKKNQELSKKVAALEQKNKLMGRQQAVLQKLNEGLARRSLLVEQRSERLRACIAAHGITEAVTDDDEGEEEEPRPPPDTHPHPESDTEETETADEDWAMSQDSSPEQTGTTSKIRPKPLNDLLRVSHQKNVKIINVLAKSKRRMPRKATNTTLGKRSRHNSVTSKNSRIETCVEPLVEETSCVGSEQADPLSLMTPDEIKIEDDIKIEEPDIEEYIAATKQI